MNTPPIPDEPLYQLGLALLELLDKPILLELEHHDHNPALALTGTLIRAFDPPTPTAPPSITIMTGAQTINIRLTEIKKTHYQRSNPPNQTLLAIHLLLADGYALHLKPRCHGSKENKPTSPQP